jgi:hypothetical protein
MKGQPRAVVVVKIIIKTITGLNPFHGTELQERKQQLMLPTLHI